LDYNISDAHRLTVRHNYVDAFDDNLQRTISSFYFSNDGYQFNSTTNQTVAQLTSSFGSNFANELILGYTRIRDIRAPYGNPFPFVRIKNFAGGADLDAGTEQYSMANKLDQDIFEITDNFTWFAGSNVFTFGTHNELFGFENLYIRNMYGYYEFANVSEFARGNPSNYQISYSLTSNPLQSAKFKAIQYGLYGQVESSILPNLKVTAGVRVDIPTLPDKPSYNKLIDSTFGGLYNTNVVPTGNILWSPRLGFNWDVNNDKMTQVRGGAGIFSGRVPYVWISNQYGNTGVEFARLSANNLGPGFFTADPYNQPKPGAAFPALSPVATTEVDLTAKDFKMPQLLRYDLALDRQLPDRKSVV
jgi:hypothetical protein